ncbi:MAG: hypothetical protein WEB89_03505, partial [Balneolales bacterium]
EFPYYLRRNLGGNTEDWKPRYMYGNDQTLPTDKKSFPDRGKNFWGHIMGFGLLANGFWRRE